MTPLADQRVLVLGGTSGIGLSAARLSADAGAWVTVASRAPERLRDAWADIPQVSAVALDVTDAKALEAYLAAEQWDHVAISAAETPTGPARTLGTDAARAAMASKFWGAYDVARLARIREGGSLTLVSGFLAVRPSAVATLQGAINAAIEGLVRGLALELAPVRVNAVSPGVIATPLWDGMEASARWRVFEAEGARLPVGRVGQPDDIGRAILFLMTNGFTTGATVLVDGGGAIA